MKILFCSPNSSTGGISSWTNNILDYNAQMNDGVEIKCFYPDVSQDSVVDSPGMISRLARGLKLYLPFVMGLRRELSSESYDVVHFSTSAGFSLLRDYLCLRLCRKRNVPSVLHLHFGRTPNLLTGDNWESRLFKKCVGLASMVIAIDSPTHESLLHSGFKNVCFLANPLSDKVVSIIKRCGDIPCEKGLIVYAGHVLPTKGVFELVKACRQLQAVKVEILGMCTDEVRSRLLSEAGSEAEQWLDIRGNCSHDEVIRSMKRSSVFVLPSYSEGFPNVIIESMACGCNIVATEVGAIPEMLDMRNNPCGRCVAPKDVDALKNALSEALTDDSDEKCAAAVDRVEREYSMPIIYSKLTQIWKSL